VPEEAVRSAAFDKVKSRAGKAGGTLGTIRARMYAPVLAALRDTTTPFG
jgi:hypothetical protein